MHRLHGLIDLQRAAAGQGDREQFHHHDDAFHATLADIAGHGTIWTIIDQSKANLDRFRRLTLQNAGQMARVIEEHTAIIERIAARDAEGAHRLLTAHLRDVLRMVEALRDLHRDLFLS